MTGRQVLITNKGFERDELFNYLTKNWNTEDFPLPVIEKPTPGSIAEYIVLPASYRFLVIIYPKKAGGLFNKKNKVVLSVCDSPAAIREKIVSSVPSKSIIFGAFKIDSVMSQENERKGPAEESLIKYTEYIKDMLKSDGLLAE